MNISIELICGIVVAFVQGYFSVPEYRLVYVAICFLCQRKIPSRKRELNPFSTLNFSLELFSLCITSVLLLIPYMLFFMIFEAPEGINTAWLWAFAVGFVVFRVKQEVEFSRIRKSQPIYVDPSNIDSKGRAILNSFWTLRDIERHLVKLDQGKEVNVYTYYPEKNNKRGRKVTGSGTVFFDGKEKRWVVGVNWKDNQNLKNPERS